MRRRTCRSVERDGGREGEGGKESKGNIILVEWVEREGGGFVKVRKGTGGGGRTERKTIILLSPCQPSRVPSQTTHLHQLLVVKNHQSPSASHSPLSLKKVQR